MKRKTTWILLLSTLVGLSAAGLVVAQNATDPNATADANATAGADGAAAVDAGAEADADMAAADDAAAPDMAAADDAAAPDMAAADDAAAPDTAAADDGAAPAEGDTGFAGDGDDVDRTTIVAIEREGGDGFDADGGGVAAAADGAWSACSGAAVGDGLVAVADLDESREAEREFDQSVDVEEDDILLGIALANNGASDITWNKLRDYDATVDETITLSRSSDLDREDVFSALALGVDAEGGSLDALACVSDVETEASQSRTVSRDVDLDEDNVLLAIALSNSVGGDLVFDDIADLRESETLRRDVSQDVDVDRDDTFLALALGAGGNA